MKKFTLILAVMLCSLMAVKAQTYEQEEFYGYYYHYTPGLFSINENPYLIAHSYNDDYYVYNTDFELIETFHPELSDNEYLVILKYDDIDNSISGEFHCTQNLFNNDEFFEYVTWGDANRWPYSSFSIKSSNGDILQTISMDDGFWLYDDNFHILKMSNRIYLLVVERNEDYSEVKSLVYQINQVQGLTKVDVDLPFIVFPTMPTREEQITVELGEGTNATAITVVNSLGQVVKHVPVEESQRTVTIPANELGSGLKVVNARNSQGQGSCKIIVR